ncbi:HemK2/MTQ2 family protein methyltransferase [Actinosynnema sp. CA-248983]
MWLWRPPGVYRPQEDTWLAAQALSVAGVPEGARVLDVCAGTGVLGILAGLAGAAEVTAVDRSRRAVVAAWCNGRARGVPVRVRHADFGDLVGEGTYDVVLANPPYVPAPGTPARGRAVAWDAGPDGRSVLDRLCAVLPLLLADNGMAVIVHSALADEDRTLRQLRGGGLKAAVVARRVVPFGPVLRRRAEWLRANGFVEPGRDREELVVVRADAA